METYRLHPETPNRFVNASRSAGFSLLEVLIAIPILIIGMSAMAALVAQTLTGTERARDMGLAATLASEKLEDLDRWPTIDPNVAGGGSITADTAVGTIDYFDDVVFADSSGQVSETISTKAGGVTTYVTTAHKADGTVTQTTSTTAPLTAGQTAFHRQWLIEMNPVVNGITVQAPGALLGPRRVTVVVKLTNQTVKPAVSFQMSMVRP
jgi:Tfp pilus assembly protein PilV